MLQYRIDRLIPLNGWLVAHLGYGAVHLIGKASYRTDRIDASHGEVKLGQRLTTLPNRCCKLAQDLDHLTMLLALQFTDTIVCLDHLERLYI